MKSILGILITLILISCNNSNKTNNISESKVEKKIIDTTLVKIENKIDKSYEIGFYQKSYTYCWITEKDTLDFKIGVTEYVRDSLIQISVYHRNPLLFSETLGKIADCLPLIEQNFNLNKLNSLYFEPPIFYKDLTSELSKAYKNQFGEKNIDYNKLNEFLKHSWLDKKLGIFLKQLGKNTKNYGIEKFHLLNKEYYGNYIPNENMSKYPEFSIHGMGITINIKKNE